MEELDIAGILETLAAHDLSPIERVLAAHTGTVQLLLSLWWDEEVVVEVDGPQVREGDRLRRAVMLKLIASGLVVARAISYIDVTRNKPEVMAEVEAGKRGIGQIAIAQRIPTIRRIREVRIEDGDLKRVYVIEGDGIHYEIEESFPRALYAGWPQDCRPA